MRLPLCQQLSTSTARAGNQLYIFGGAPQQGPMLADLWRLDLATMAWQRLQPAGQQPAPRCSHAAAAVDGSIVYCGGAFYKESGGLQVGCSGGGGRGPGDPVRDGMIDVSEQLEGQQVWGIE
jgi:hypothetical protein